MSNLHSVPLFRCLSTPWKCTVAVCWMSILAACQPVAVQAPPNFSQDFRAGAELKSRAEQRVQLLKREEYAEAAQSGIGVAEGLYIDARSSVDGWVTGLQGQIISGVVGSDAAQTEALGEVSADANAFIDYTKLLLGDDVPRGVFDDTTFQDVLDVGEEISNRLDQVQARRRNEMAQSLEVLRWREFDAIAP